MMFLIDHPEVAANVKSIYTERNAVKNGEVDEYIDAAMVIERTKNRPTQTK